MQFAKYHVCCSYDEILGFKHSVAVDASAEYSSGLAFYPNNGLIHWSGDNFYSEIHSQNCKTLRHCYATVIGQAAGEESGEVIV